MTAGGIFFILCSIVCVAGAIATVAAKNPIRGAMGLLATIVGIAGLFLKLRAEFLAAIQLIVYAGAVVVLFVFVLMLLGPAAVPPEKKWPTKLSRWVSGLLMAAVCAGGLFLILGASDGVTPFKAAPGNHGTVEAVGKLMFSSALSVFELSTALLIVAVIGAIAVARGKQGVLKNKSTGPTDPKDFFAGPLMARDAARPLAEAKKGAEG